MIFPNMAEYSGLFGVSVIAQSSFARHYAMEAPLSTFREFKEWGCTVVRHRLGFIRIPTPATGSEVSPLIKRLGL